MSAQYASIKFGAKYWRQQAQWARDYARQRPAGDHKGWAQSICEAVAFDRLAELADRAEKAAWNDLAEREKAVQP